MGKIIRKLKIGRPCNKKNKKWRIAPTLLPNDVGKEETGKISKIVHERGRVAALAIVEVARGEDENRENAINSYSLPKRSSYCFPATERMHVGMEIMVNTKEERDGNIMMVKNVHPGANISCVEKVPGDCGSFAKASGTKVVLSGYNEMTNEAIIRLPSGRKMVIDGTCRCIVGQVSGGGVKEKPFLTAGRKYYYVKSRQKFAWPRVSATCMNPVDHIFGGGNHQHVGRPTTVARGASPGRKVGQIAARRTGLRKKRSKKNNRPMANAILGISK